MNKSAGVLLVLAQALACAQESPPVAFRHASVIDGTGAPMRPDQTVIVRGNRISAIGPEGQVAVPGNAIAVDASGRFLIPGLWDMHIHLRGSFKGEKLLKENEATLSLYLANGVTGVREMGGDMAETVLLWRQEIAEGQRLGPRIATAALKLDGPRPVRPQDSIAIQTPEEARAAVQRVKALGADFVKIYNGLGPEALIAAVEEAKQGLRVTGHPAGNFTMREISEMRMDIEHANPTMALAATRDELSLVRPSNGPKLPIFSPELFRAVVDQYDPEAVKELATRFARNGTSLTPTLHTSLAIVLPPDTADPRRRYLMPRMLTTWTDRSNGSRAVFLDPVRRKLTRIEERVVAELRAAGVTILAGSDAGSSNQNLYPGFSLHSELVELVEAGMTPMQTIQAATLDAARWLGRERELGSIEAGKLADLVLLDANPLDDIRNTAKIRAVVANGRLLDRPCLDAILKAAEEAAKQ